MNYLALAHFTTFLICVWLIFFTLSKNPKARQNITSALVLCCYAIWNFAYTFFQTSVSKNEAMFWFNIASFGWGSFASFGLWFSLVFGKQETLLKKWSFYVFVFSISAVLIYKQWTGYLVNDLRQQFYGWDVVWSDSIWSWLYYAYYLSLMIISFGIWYRIGRKARFSYEKKQAQVICLAGWTVFVLGTISDVLFPRFKVTEIPPIGPLLILIWAAGMVYVIIKYKLMVLTPAFAAADILSNMSDSLILVDPEGRIIEANNATLNLLGYSRKEMIAKPARMFFAEGVPLFKGPELDKLFTEDWLKDYKISYQTKAGESIPISFSGSIMRDPDGNVIGIVGVARDMREILRLQESEREFIVEKARSEALQERAQELQEAYDQLKTVQAQLIQSEKMAAVGQLAGGVAHEINNPMGVILGFAQSIVKRIQNDDTLYLPLKSIEREAMRCKKLVGDLLTFSRTEKTEAEFIDIHQTVDETLTLIEVRTKTENIEIIREYTAGLPHIKANKNQIQQVIVNICNNAIDAMPGGGQLSIITRQASRQIEILISDTGQGMNEEVKKHIFEPFFTTKEIGKGTGLGLSLCFNIIQRHNGAIEVESETGKGATFRINLPVNEK